MKCGKQGVLRMFELKDIFCKIAKSAGEIILNADREQLDINSKQGSANFVTKYDVLVEEYLKENLLKAVPDAIFIGEEGDESFSSDLNKAFIVDPIDGTTNFIKDYHMSCISIAYLQKGEVIISVIYNPFLDEMFCAERGKGAFCNGARIHVSKYPLENGLVLFGSCPYHKELWKKSFELAYEYFEKALDVRRSGSAALDLCSIAAGRAELYFELLLSPWDYAAGILLVEEAGGTVTDMNGEKVGFDKPSSIIASNGLCV